MSHLERIQQPILIISHQACNELAHLIVVCTARCLTQWPSLP